MTTTRSGDLTVLRLDLERLRRRLAAGDGRYQDVAEVHAWLRTNRFAATARAEVYIRSCRTTGELLGDEVVVATSYA